MTRHEAATRYRQLGFPVFPVNRQKKPLVLWKKYMEIFPTEDELEEWFLTRRLENMGVVTGGISNLLMVDADEHKRIGAIADIEARMQGVNCPMQITPKGGRHYLFTHREGLSNTSDYAPGVDVRTTGGYFVVWPSMGENGNRWTWAKGRSPFEIPIPPIPEELFSWLQGLMRRQQQTTGRNEENSDIEWFKDGRRDNDLFHVANCLRKGRAEEALMRSVLTRLVASWGEKDEQWVNTKVESAMKRDEQREAVIAEEVKDWVMTTTGNFLTTDVHRELNLTTRDHKKAAVMALLRLEREGLIRKYGSKRGCYETVDNSVEEMDWRNADPNDFLKIEWPLGLERKTRIFPRSVIILAGVTGTGKTTYLLDLIRMNMDKHSVIYHNSEMSPQAMNYKLSMFHFPVSEWKFKLLKWDGNTDQVEPDALNIIDYLQAPEHVWQIQQSIARILGKLNRGIAVIAVQKKPGSMFGTGGMWSAMDASLVLGLEFQKAKVEKNRFREADEFAGLDCRTWTIKHGNVIAESGWYADEAGNQKRGFQRRLSVVRTQRSADPEFPTEDDHWDF